MAQKTGHVVMMVIVCQLSEPPTSQPAVPRALHSVLGVSVLWGALHMQGPFEQ